MKSFSRKKGSILIFVLAIIVFISVLSVRLMKETTQELRHVSQFHRCDDLRTYAYSALDLVVGVLNEFQLFTGQLSFDQAWSKPFEYAEMIDPTIIFGEDSANLGRGVKWRVSLIDESGKLPLRSANDANLATFFATFDSKMNGSKLVEEEDGKPYVDILRDWQDHDDKEREEGAEDDFYEDLNPSYFSPDRAIGAFGEFKWIKGFGFSDNDPESEGLFFDSNGMETESFRAFKRIFSLYNEDAINPLGFSEDMLRVIAGDDNRLYEELLELKSSGDGRDRDEYIKIIRELTSKMGLSLINEVRVFRALITVTRGKAVFKLHAVLSSKKGNSRNTGSRQKNSGKTNRNNSMKFSSERNTKIMYPFYILALRENENLID